MFTPQTNESCKKTTAWELGWSGMRYVVVVPGHNAYLASNKSAVAFDVVLHTSPEGVFNIYNCFNSIVVAVFVP